MLTWILTLAAVRLANLRAVRYISFIARCMAIMATNLRSRHSILHAGSNMKPNAIYKSVEDYL